MMTQQPPNDDDDGDNIIVNVDDNDDGTDELRERAHEVSFSELEKILSLTSTTSTTLTSISTGSQTKKSPSTSETTTTTTTTTSSSNKSLNLNELRENVVHDMVGNDMTFESPFEWNTQLSSSSSSSSSSSKQQQQHLTVPMVYCDFTASHRPLKSIEKYLEESCMMYYGNTHTNTSITGSQSSAYVSEARQIIAEACGAKITGKASQDIVLFAGNGTTSAVQLLIDCMGLKHYSTTTGTSTTRTTTTTKIDDRPVIILGPMEHHSNLLPWRELGDGYVIEMVQYDVQSGNIDMMDLETILRKHRHRTVKIGCFSAASNLTGTIANDIVITALLHKHGALSFWDYATGASYLDMNMNPTNKHRECYHNENNNTSNTNHSYYDPSMIAKDAIFFSGHKLLGGVSCPGVLIVKKRLVSSLNPPSRCGGGTVFYVTEDHHRFLSNRVERFEGGTPNIVGIWRLGLVFRFKMALSKKLASSSLTPPPEFVMSPPSNPTKSTTTLSSLQSSAPLLMYDLARAHKIQIQLREIPNLVLLDAHTADSATTGSFKLPIFSFLIKCGTRFLHYNYVCAILNDVFGIQSRGGCQCAGPYAQLMLGMVDTNTNRPVEDWLVHTKDELLRPGVTRISLPTLGTTQQQEDYVIDAIRWIAHHGWKLLHVYRCNHRSGEWRHKSRPGSPLGTNRRWLSHIPLPWWGSNNKDSTTSTSSSSSVAKKSNSAYDLDNAMANADAMLELSLKDQSSISQALKMVEEDESAVSTLRWYVYPKDVARYVREGLDEVPGTMDKTNLQGALFPFALREKKDVILMNEGNSITSIVEPTIVLHHFKDGDHIGEAPMDEIVEGISNGELSEGCQVYDPSADSWELVSSFVQEKSTDDGGEELLAPNTSLDQAPTSENGNFVTFRDGNHSGAAPLNEIVAGFEDGELSDMCEIYDTNLDSWVSLPSKLEEMKLTQDDTGIPDGTDPNPYPVDTTQDPYDELPLVEKNNHKKPQRGSTEWGKGEAQNLQPVIQSESTSYSSVDVVLRNPEKQKHLKPPPKLMRLVTQAIIQWDMLEDGDRLLLGLSGGKDSMSLLHILLEMQKKSPIRFDIEVCTIDPLTPSFDPSPLIPYVESLGLKYHYIRDDIVERATVGGKDGQLVTSLCAYCARMKRGNLYSCARKNNCNKLVLAQHLDDLAESFMMSVMHNGFLRTMKANYKINAGDLSVIRPLAYCRESMMTEFARSASLPIINENCPACFEEPKERARMKKLLAKEETLYPNFYDNIKRAMLPLMHDDATAILRSYTEEALAKSRKENSQERRRQVAKKKKAGGKSIEQVIGNLSQDSTCESNDSVTASSTTLADASEDQLLHELALRRAERFRLAGAMQRRDAIDDPTGQVCSLNGENNSIPCRELME